MARAIALFSPGGFSLRLFLGWLLAIVVLLALPLSSRHLLAAGSGAGSATAIPGTHSVTPGITPVAEHFPPRHNVVMIVIDAGRPSYFSLAKLPHLQALMRQGIVYNQAWTGEMQSTTPNVHVTLGTGTLPRENGFLGFGWAAPQTRDPVDFRTLLADGQIDPVLRSLPVASIASLLHTTYPGSVSIAASGHKNYAVVGLGGGAANYELYGKFLNNHFVPTFLHGPPPLSRKQLQGLTVKSPLPIGAEDSWAVRYSLDVIRRTKPQLFMINLPEVDTWGHWYGPDDHAVFRRLMLNFDRLLGQIEATYRSLGMLKNTDFIITADHAMVESRAAHDWHLIYTAAHRAGTGIARADGGAGSIWLKDPNQAKAVAQNLVALKPAHVQAVFYRSSTNTDFDYVQASPSSWEIGPNDEAALKFLVDTTDGRTGPDVWMIYREAYTAAPRNVAGKWKGTHGGATWQVQHIPLIISGPGVKAGVRSSYPAQSVDMAATTEYLLGLHADSPTGVVLADALRHPPLRWVQEQRKLAPALSRYVSGLEFESRRDNTRAVPPPGFFPLRCTTSPHPVLRPPCKSPKPTNQ
ncbi:MAG: alkaline phosphatase family protein [Chloroflexota bacterium]